MMVAKSRNTIKMYVLDWISKEDLPTFQDAIACGVDIGNRVIPMLTSAAVEQLYGVVPGQVGKDCTSPREKLDNTGRAKDG